MSKQGTVPNKFAPQWLAALDARTTVAQTMRARYAEMTNDLGGADNLSLAKRILVERALWLLYWLETQEQALAQGEAFDAAKWTQGANSLQGILAKLGLERQAREVSLSDFIAAKGGSQ